MTTLGFSSNLVSCVLHTLSLNRQDTNPEATALRLRFRLLSWHPTPPLLPIALALGFLALSSSSSRLLVGGLSTAGSYPARGFFFFSFSSILFFLPILTVHKHSQQPTWSRLRLPGTSLAKLASVYWVVLIICICQGSLVDELTYLVTLECLHCRHGDGQRAHHSIIPP